MRRVWPREHIAVKQEYVRVAYPPSFRHGDEQVPTSLPKTNSARGDGDGDGDDAMVPQHTRTRYQGSEG